MDQLLHIVAVAALACIQLIFTIYLVPIISLVVSRRTSKEQTTHNTNKSRLKVAILIPAYKEKDSSIIKTLKSIAEQSYSKELLKIYLVLEEHDENSKNNLNAVKSFMKKEHLKYEVIYNNSDRKYGKAEALNKALKYVEEDAIIVFDADDEIPRNYVEEVVKELENGAYAVTTKVYRDGEGWHAKLLLIDTILWYDIILPSMLKLNQYIPLSGEGLALKTSFIKSIGGFPRKLTEDAYLAIILAEKNSKITYLSRTFIVERSPRNLFSQIKQRIRWFQGYYECLLTLIRKLRSLGLRKSITLLITFMSPVAAIATMISHTILASYWLAYIIGLNNVVSAIQSFYVAPIFYWGLLLLTIGNVFLIYFLLYMIADTRYEKHAHYVFLMPLYWYFNGLVAIASIFLPRKWWKTER